MLNADAFKHKSKTDLRERKTNYSPGGVKEGETRNQAKYRYRKVTICARTQSASGLKVVADVPLVTSFATAQFTASV